MGNSRAFRPLAPEEIRLLEARGCRAEDWGRVLVAAGFDPASVVRASFAGTVRIGSTAGTVRTAHGGEKPCGIYDAALTDCTVGDGCRIARVGVHLSGYDLGDGVSIEDVGVMQANPGASFGNGVEVEVLNEAGGREVVLFDELSAPFAYLLCLHRHRPRLVEALRAMAAAEVERARSDRGRIGPGARIVSCREIVDVRVGPAATVAGAASLVNGTILSHPEAPTVVGSNVTARDFIIAEGSRVDGGAILTRTFVGQGCLVGRQFSAEHCLFFANSEAFHGEACSVFAGPYTVSHHKSTLLIAGLFSFYNAGSGTNQSNHMYKLGPCHEGKLERGCKTGSFSYMMWPCRLGPFSVVLGKHTGTFDTSDFPFSHLEARADGRCVMIPGLHVTTVGTVRDGLKWPARDRRKGPVRRDPISFAVFSPYTVGKMMRALELLRDLQERTEKTVEEVSVGGALVRRPILRTAQKYYRNGTEVYLLEKVFERVESALAAGGAFDTGRAFAVDPGAVGSPSWVDLGGLLMPRDRMLRLEDAVERGEISSVRGFAEALEGIRAAGPGDEWAWVIGAWNRHFGRDLRGMSREEVLQVAAEYGRAKGKFLTLVLADAEKEFDEQSRTGFGMDGAAEEAAADFERVRGRYETNPFVRELRAELERLAGRVEKVVAALRNP